jgi:hypothetical protein
LEFLQTFAKIFWIFCLLPVSTTPAIRWFTGINNAGNKLSPVIVTSNKLLLVSLTPPLGLVPDSHQFHDTGYLFIDGNNDTGDVNH